MARCASPTAVRGRPCDDSEPPGSSLLAEPAARGRSAARQRGLGAFRSTGKWFAGAATQASVPLALLSLTAALAIVVRLPFLGVPLISDEGGYAYVAYFWSQGDALYRDLPFDRPQGIFLIYRAILATLGTDVAAIRLAGSICAALTAGAVLLLARAMFTLRAALLAAGAFAVLSASPSIEGFTANAEVFANLPIVMAALGTWRRRWGWAGLCAGVAVIVKPSGVSALLLAGAWLAWHREPLRSWTIACAGFLVVPLLSLAHGVSVGWDAYFRSLVTDRLMAFSVITAGADTQWERLADGVIATSPAWAILAVLAACALPAAGRERGGFALAWIGSSIAGMSIGGNWYLHYFIQLIPPLAVLGGSARFGHGWRRAAALGAFAAACGLFAARDALVWRQDPRTVCETIYAGRPGYLFGEAVADAVAARTAPGESVYVAFSEAQLYYLARRRAAAPDQLYWNQAQYNRAAFDQAIEAIRLRRPAVVVWAQQATPHWIEPEAFRRILRQGYTPVQTLGGIEISVRRQSARAEPDPAAPVRHSHLAHAR